MKQLQQVLSFFIIAAILLLITSLLILSVGSSIPKATGSFLAGIFGSLYGVSEVLVRATPLIFAGLGVSVGFRTGFFNIGAEGQIYIGAAALTSLALFFPSLPFFPALILSLGAGFLAGGIWAAIPGFFKARFKISEVINTIMFNYIAINIIGILIRSLLKDPDYPLPMSAELPVAYQLPQFLLPTRLHLGFILALLCSGGVYLLMWKSSMGYKLRAVGLNARCCLCSGISVKKYTILASLISGGLAGLAGVSEVAGIHLRLMEGFSPGFGYIAIIVSLIGKNHPLGIIGASLGIAALQVGSLSMQRQAGVPTSISWIIMGVLVIAVLSRKRLLAFTRGAVEEM